MLNMAHTYLTGYTKVITGELARYFVIEKRKNILLLALLVIAFVVLTLDRIAQDNYLYWTYWWYDIMMHFLGGFLVAGIALWFLARFSHESVRVARRALIVAVVTAVIVGTGWEFFEYFSGALLQQNGSIVGDTALDLVMDTVGALVMWGILVKIFFVRRIDDMRLP